MVELLTKIINKYLLSEYQNVPIYFDITESECDLYWPTKSLHKIDGQKYLVKYYFNTYTKENITIANELREKTLTFFEYLGPEIHEILNVEFSISTRK